MTTTLKAPFGEFRGKKRDGVVQYLGIKYGNLKDQLAVPEMVDDYGNEVIDATEFGPRAIAADACQFEQDVLIQQRIDTPTPPPMSSLDCLNLNITVPDVDSQKPFPVMVFIHGGGYIMGANWWPQYDQARLVKLSVEAGLPVIAINFNYRLGALGNLTSEELQKAGYPGNNSLRDQKCALQWVKAHIEGFGGDPHNVTAFGESAASVLSQLFSKDPLFKRAISMAGTPIMVRPILPPVTEVAYASIMKELGLENASVDERLQRLLTISPDELVSKTPMTVPLIPFVDGDVVPAMTTFKELESGPSAPGRQWCSELMVGDCQHDGNVFAYMGLEALKSGIAARFTASLTNNLTSPTATSAVLQAYNLSTSTRDDVAMKTLIDYGTDIAYYAPAVFFARSWPGNTYYYNFHETNPWDGPWKGYSTHMLDAAFLFQNYNERLSSEARDVAVSLAKDFVKFAHGVAPWKEYSREHQNVKSFGPSGTLVSDEVERRRNALFKLKEEGKVDLDELRSAWDKFLAGQ